MKPLLYFLFLLLMLLGNCFALYKMFTERQEFLSRFPKLTETGFNIFRLLPILNIMALAGMWFFKSWAAYLAIACGIAVIVLDIYFGIRYHLYVAIPSAILLLFFIIKYRNLFK